MKATILWTAGIVAAVALGYVTAFGYSQELVWLLAPGIGLIIAVVVASKILR